VRSRKDVCAPFLFWCMECGKNSYVSRKAAKKALRGMLGKVAKDEAKCGVLVVYPCDHGNGFHIGHRAAPRGAQA